MTETITAMLEQGENTPDWDAQKLHGAVVVLHSTELYMTPDEHKRFTVLVNRLRQKMREALYSDS